MLWTLAEFKFLPDQASTLARDHDYLFYFNVLTTVLETGAVFLLVATFGLRYRRRSEDEFPRVNPQSRKVELACLTFLCSSFLLMFVWGADVYVKMKRPPQNALTINVIGKQWMWKVQHEGGQREINQLHVPLGQPVKLIIASQDVIHDFGIPAFRIKQDVIPGSFNMEWFTATRPGRYHIFCDQYCGAEHAKMIGVVFVMPAAEYQAWLAGAPADVPPAAAGAQLFQTWGCAACHGQRAPSMAGLYLSQVPLDNGQKVLADEAYLRESIIEPAAKVVAGYPPIMPSYRGQLSEEQIMDLVDYVKSLGSSAGASGVRNVPATQPSNGESPDYVPNYPPARQPPEIPRGPGETGPEEPRVRPSAP